MSRRTSDQSVILTREELKHKAEEVSVILVVGLTGAGKSFFISSIAGAGTAAVGHGLRSQTEKCQVIPTVIGRRKILLIDTPGFDDTNFVKNSDSIILADIAKVLSKQYELGATLRGVIYIHNIVDNRYGGTSVKNLAMFRKIIGDEGLSNIILTTTQWSRTTESLGAEREGELRRDFWNMLLAKGACMARYMGDRDSAMGIISQMLGKVGVVLEMQKELAQGKRLDETSAGALISSNVSDLQTMLQEEREVVASLRQEAETNQRLADDAQRALEENQTKMQKVREDEMQLRRRIAEEVQQEWQEKWSQQQQQRQKPNRNWGQAVQAVTGVAGLAVHIIFGFLGIGVPLDTLSGGWFD